MNKKVFYTALMLTTSLTYHNGWSQQKYTWTGAVSKVWNEPGNWVPNGVPGASDTIQINTGNCDFTGSGNLTFAALYFSGGYIDASDTILIKDKMEWLNQTIRWTGGAVKIAAGATFTLGGTKPKIMNNSVLINDGTMVWKGTGVFTLDAGASIINNGLMELRNNSELRRGTGLNVSFTNASGGTIRKLNPATKTVFGEVLNFNNDGRIEVQEGSLEIRSHGIFTGSVDVTNGSMLSIGIGTLTWTETSSLITNGSLEILHTVSTSVTDFRGILNIRGNTIVNGGLMKVSGTQVNLGDSLILNRGTLQAETAGITVPVIHIARDGKLVVNSKMTVGQKMDWAGGIVEGSDTLFVPANAIVRLYSQNWKRMGVAAFVNDGKIVWEDDGDIRLTAGAGLYNRNLFEIKNNAAIKYTPAGTGGWPAIYNLDSGVIIKDSGGTTVFGSAVNVNNSGLIDVQAGTLELQFDGIYTGRLVTADGAVLKFSGGNHEFNPGFSLEVKGQMLIDAISAADLKFNEDFVLPPGLSLLRGSIGGTGVLTVADTMRWSGGDLRDTSRFVIDSTGVLLLTGNQAKYVREKIMINKGTIVLEEERLVLYDKAKLENYGTIKFLNGEKTGISSGNFGGTLLNASSGRVIALPGDNRVYMGLLHFINYGYLELNERNLEFSRSSFIGKFTQFDGETRLINGQLSVFDANINGGTLMGSGTIAGNLKNRGIVDPGIDSTRFGRLYVEGEYMQDSSAVLKIDIGGRSPGSGYDQLTTNTAKLDGLLDLHFNSGADSLFSAYPNAKFRVMRWLEAPNTGQFDSISNMEYQVFKVLPDGSTAPNPEIQQMEAVYSYNSLTLYRGEGKKDVWFQFVGRNAVRPGRTARIKMYYNNFSSDTLVVPFIITLENGMIFLDEDTLKHYPDKIPWEPPVDEDYFNNNVKKKYLSPDGTTIRYPIVLTVPPSEGPDGSGGGPGSGGSFLRFSATPDCVGPRPTVTADAADALSPEDEKCLWELAGELIGFIPGGDCIKLAAKAALGGVKGDFSSTKTAGNWVAQSGWDVAKCAVSFVPGLKLVTKTVEVVDKVMSPLGHANTAAACVLALMPGPDGNSATLGVECVSSKDPNEKIGPEGITNMRYIKATDPAAFTVFFENVDSATAPAQTVNITDHLDPAKWDLSTFSFLPITIADTTIGVPANVPRFEKVVDLSAMNGVLVRISAELNELTGDIYWTFESLDPVTKKPVTDPLAGFLPPNVNHPEGQADVGYRVEPNADLPSGTPLGGDAVIVFDNNEPIRTNAWINHIENTPPRSHMTPATIEVEREYMLTWTGTDEHSGIKSYDLYYAVNDGPFQKLLSTRDTSYLFEGAPCNTYRFFTLARDSANNREANKAAEVEITINPYLSTSINLDGESVLCDGDSTLLWVPYDTLATAYAWYRDGTLISQDTVVHVKEGGNYIVDIARDSSCSFSVGPVVITQSHVSKPAIVQSGNKLSVPDDYDTYQWYLDDNPLTGASGHEITADTEGSYSVLVTNKDGCSVLSDAFVFEITGLDNTGGLTVYPNPGADQLVVKFNEEFGKQATIEIYDISGQLVKHKEFHSIRPDMETRINIHALLPGVFFIHIRNEEKVAVFKFVKK